MSMIGKRGSVLGLCLAFLPLSLGAEALMLFGAKKPETYKYAFPDPGSSVSVSHSEGNWLAAFALKADVAAGGGLGTQETRLRDKLAKGALQFLIRGSKGGEQVNVGLVMAKSLKPGDQNLQVLLPLSGYVAVTTAWQKVTIPLKDFPKQGSRWSASQGKNMTGPFNWDRVIELTLSREAEGSGLVQLSVANIQVVPSYDAKTVQITKPKAGTLNGPVDYFTEAFSADGGGFNAYPAKTSVSVTQGKSGKGLKLDLPADAWAGLGIYRQSVDLRASRASGFVEGWVKGAMGGETLYFGLTDKSAASLRAPLPVAVSTAWQPFRLPLSALTGKAKKWDSMQNKHVELDFDWSQVSELLIDNNGPGQTGVVYLDELAIKRKP